jgi:hypothetical protein
MKGYKQQVQDSNFTTIFLLIEVIVFASLIWILVK